MKNKEIEKNILEECNKFGLNEKTTSEDILRYWKEFKCDYNGEYNCMNITSKAMYLYEYLINEMIKDNEISVEDGIEFMEELKNKLKLEE